MLKPSLQTLHKIWSMLTIELGFSMKNVLSKPVEKTFLMACRGVGTKQSNYNKYKLYFSLVLANLFRVGVSA